MDTDQDDPILSPDDLETCNNWPLIRYDDNRSQHITNLHAYFHAIRSTEARTNLHDDDELHFEQLSQSTEGMNRLLNLHDRTCRANTKREPYKSHDHVTKDDIEAQKVTMSLDELDADNVFYELSQDSIDILPCNADLGLARELYNQAHNGNKRFRTTKWSDLRCLGFALEGSFQDYFDDADKADNLPTGDQISRLVGTQEYIYVRWRHRSKAYRHVYQDELNLTGDHDIAQGGIFAELLSVKLEQPVRLAVVTIDKGPSGKSNLRINLADYPQLHEDDKDPITIFIAHTGDPSGSRADKHKTRDKTADEVQVKNRGHYSMFCRPQIGRKNADAANRSSNKDEDNLPGIRNLRYDEYKVPQRAPHPLGIAPHQSSADKLAEQASVDDAAAATAVTTKPVSATFESTAKEATAGDGHAESPATKFETTAQSPSAKSDKEKPKERKEYGAPWPHPRTIYKSLDEFCWFHGKGKYAGRIGSKEKGIPPPLSDKKAGLAFRTDGAMFAPSRNLVQELLAQSLGWKAGNREQKLEEFKKTKKFKAALQKLKDQTKAKPSKGMVIEFPSADGKTKLSDFCDVGAWFDGNPGQIFQPGWPASERPGRSSVPNTEDRRSLMEAAKARERAEPGNAGYGRSEDETTTREEIAATEAKGTKAKDTKAKDTKAKDTKAKATKAARNAGATAATRHATTPKENTATQSSTQSQSNNDGITNIDPRLLDPALNPSTIAPTTGPSSRLRSRRPTSPPTSRASTSAQDSQVSRPAPSKGRKRKANSASPRGSPSKRSRSS